MNPPVTTDALVEALAQTMWEQSYGTLANASWSEAHQIAETIPDGQAAWNIETVRRKAAEIVNLHVAPLLAAHQQVTAERDVARAENDRFRASAEEMWETAKRHGGQMLAEKRRADTATSELARLRAEKAERKAADEALRLNDGELDADPQKLIAHLQRQCRDFIRERDEWKASAKAEWARADRLRAEGEAKDRVAGCLRASVREFAQSADRSKAEIKALRAALDQTKAAADELAPVCIAEGDNKAAGALQFISGFVSDRLAAIEDTALARAATAREG